MIKKTSGLGLLVLMVISNISIAHAATAASPGLSPAIGNESMHYEAKPNSKIEDSLMIENMGGESGTFEIFVATPKEGEYDIAPWITLSEKNVTMIPGEKKNITFSISIPSDAMKEKTYQSAISAKAMPTVDKKTITTDSNTTSSSIKVTSQVSSKLTVKVTDNPTAVGTTSTDKDENSTNGGDYNKILLIILAALIISIGYLFYRKK